RALTAWVVSHIHRTGSPPARAAGSAGLRCLAHDALCVALDVGLSRPCQCERAGGHVVDDDRAGPGPGTVAERHGCNQHAVGSGAYVGTDRGALLAAAELGAVVGGDVAGTDVGALADGGIADVREVRHLGACADDAVLDL